MPVTLNDIYKLWKKLKRGLKDNTFQNYQYMYRTFVEPSFGRKRIASLIKSDIKRFYNTLVDERGLSVSTVDGVHTVLHQLLDMAVDDRFIRHNPADNVLKELKQTHVPVSQKRHALTLEEQERFLSFLRNRYSTVTGILFLRLCLEQGCVLGKQLASAGVILIWSRGSSM